MNLKDLTTAELRDKAQNLRTEVEGLANLEKITPSQDERLSRQLKAFQEVQSELDSRRESVKASITERTPGFDDVKSPTFWKQSTRTEVFSADSNDSRVRSDNAKRAKEILETETGLEVRSDVAAHFDKNPAYADHFRATSNPDYATAWGKMLAFGESGALLRMTDAERQAFERVARTEAREMSLTDSEGGFAVPGAVDSSIMVNGSGSTSSIRNLARVVTAISDTWRGVASTGISASFVAEGAEVGDNSPSLVSPLITAHKAAAFVPMTFEIMDDWPTLVEQMRILLADAKNDLEASKFISGSGSGEPFGLLTRLNANTAADVTVTTSGSIGVPDIYAVAEALPPRFRPNASWLASMSVLNEFRSVSDDKLGNYVTDLRAGNNFTLLGRPVYEQSAMDAMVNTTAAKTFAVFGDISKTYIIFDRLASARVSIIPHLFGTTNGRPIGAAGIYYHWRVGADVITGSTSGETGSRILVNKVS